MLYQLSQLLSEYDVLVLFPYSFLFLKHLLFPIPVYNSAKLPFYRNNSTVTWFTKWLIMSTCASPAAFTISNTTPDSLAAFPFFILRIDTLCPALLGVVHHWLYLLETKLLYPMPAVYSRASHDNFSKLFSSLHHWLATHHHHFLCTVQQ